MSAEDHASQLYEIHVRDEHIDALKAELAAKDARVVSLQEVLKLTAEAYHNQVHVGRFSECDAPYCAQAHAALRDKLEVEEI